MEATKQLQIRDFNYDLPDERIAKFPLAERDTSKLLVYRQGNISQDIFTSLPKYLPKNALMVFNNTRVIQARMHFRKDTGAQIEVFCLEPIRPNDYALMFQQTQSCSWLCLVGNLKKWKSGTLKQTIQIRGKEITLTAERGESMGASHRIDFAWNDTDVTFAEILESVGELPIPPYLNRPTQESDKTTYQTVYSKIKGSVAAPTAGLHFTEDVLKAIDENGIEREEVTLHVGAGTFKPVKSEEIAEHEMHTEYISVKRSVIEKLLAHNANCIAVGTTSVRTLESLYYIGVAIAQNPDIAEEELHVKQWTPYEYAAATRPAGSADDGHPEALTPMQALQHISNYLTRHDLQALHTSTQIIIAPGYEYHIVKQMITNLHQPQSTLLLLVSAFTGGTKWKDIYHYALENDFRFLSYGDSSLLIP